MEEGGAGAEFDGGFAGDVERSPGVYEFGGEEGGVPEVVAEEQAVLVGGRVGELDAQGAGQGRGGVEEGGVGVAVLVGDGVGEYDGEGGGEEVFGFGFGDFGHETVGEVRGGHGASAAAGRGAGCPGCEEQEGA
ncbi:unnamed protein product [Parascedosporium putredinis]|uniref:Uncharacterized protein n=1 Tax=Parascedosporium putredinis TaxID=1442378 RepID=A0A9P1M966_9PEZI|nr:unnamed protein product [Parascedosporium putredinis]CAI7991412.1 unnamed protein product [Parascedosporium putredinis]